MWSIAWLKPHPHHLRWGWPWSPHLGAGPTPTPPCSDANMHISAQLSWIQFMKLPVAVLSVGGPLLKCWEIFFEFRFEAKGCICIAMQVGLCGPNPSSLWTWTSRVTLTRLEHVRDSNSLLVNTVPTCRHRSCSCSMTPDSTLFVWFCASFVNCRAISSRFLITLLVLIPKKQAGEAYITPVVMWFSFEHGNEESRRDG